MRATRVEKDAEFRLAPSIDGGKPEVQCCANSESDVHLRHDNGATNRCWRIFATIVVSQSPIECDR